MHSTSVGSKIKGEEGLGGVLRNNACTVQSTNIISQLQYFIARCLSSYVRNLFWFTWYMRFFPFYRRAKCTVCSRLM